MDVCLSQLQIGKGGVDILLSLLSPNNMLGKNASGGEQNLSLTQETCL